MNHGSLFSGIGGFDLAAQWCGWNNAFQVEIDKFCTKVLEKNFPDVKRYGDIKEFEGKSYEGAVDIISGGFPCQPFSIAGKRKSSEDNRYLWPEMFRVVSEIKPAWVVAENVRGIVSIEEGMVFEQVQADLESIGYEVQPFIIPACAKNAPHRRDRIWIIAYSDKNRTLGIRRKRGNNNQDRNTDSDSEGQLQQKGIEQIKRGRACDSGKNDSNTDKEGLQGWEQLRQSGGKGIIATETWESNWIEVATRLCGVADGVSNRVGRLKALGNAIVPQVAYEIFKAINEVEKYRR